MPEGAEGRRLPCAALGGARRRRNAEAARRIASGYDSRMAPFAAAATLLLLSSAAMHDERGPAGDDAGAASGAAASAFAARLELVSRQLLDVPYRLGPLGEEEPPDTDPRFRLDAFDCTTYVETVLALALAGEDATGAGAADAALPWLDRVRYRGGVASFETRRHLIDAQWIPQLVAEGLVRDVTREIGAGAARTESLRLRAQSWERSALHRDFGLAWSAVPAGRHTLAYLPWDALARDQVRRALPAAAILSLVAATERDTPTLVTHQALLFRTASGDLVVRHAAAGRRRVVEEPLDEFADRSRRRRSRSVLGVNVLTIEADAWHAQDHGP